MSSIGTGVSVCLSSLREHHCHCVCSSANVEIIWFLDCKYLIIKTCSSWLANMLACWVTARPAELTKAKPKEEVLPLNFDFFPPHCLMWNIYKYIRIFHSVLDASKEIWSCVSVSISCASCWPRGAKLPFENDTLMMICVCSSFILI